MPKPPPPALKDRHSTEKRGYRAHDRKGGEQFDPEGEMTAPGAIDKNDPNYVDTDDEEKPAPRKNYEFVES
ncbi:hypothetical protein Pelo_851 [Pelomyxa schiedti]|nr:hypothetical protein Pelo_851 [Pelomyxa schiedti]